MAVTVRHISASLHALIRASVAEELLDGSHCAAHLSLSTVIRACVAQELLDGSHCAAHLSLPSVIRACVAEELLDAATVWHISAALLL